ncbi:MAG: Fic family protein [Rhizobium sp.]|nr:Fic family protein [Rhizobium sp.]
METLFRAYEAISFTESHTRQIHRDRLSHSTGDEWHRSAYKTLSNHVEALDEQGERLGIVFETASLFDTPRGTEELIAWLNAQGREKRLHPVLVVPIFGVVLLEIHPFQNGNGRLSRILTTLMILRTGYACIPTAHSKASSSKARRALTSRFGPPGERSAGPSQTGAPGLASF